MNSSEYFAKRSEARMKRMHDKATNTVSKVNSSFDESIKRLKEEINHIVGSVEGKSSTDVNQYMLQKIDYDKYQDILKQYHESKDPRVRSRLRAMLKENAASYRIERKEALIRAIEAEKLRGVDTQLIAGGNHLKDVYRIVNKELGTPDIDKERLKEVLNHEWMGSNFSKRVWHNQNVLAKNIETNLMESFISGKSNKQIVDELESQTDMGRYAANRLIRTETSYMVNSADLDSSKKRGIKAKKFEANLDSRTSKICKKNNQKIIPINKIEIGKNAPPMHPFCRSFLADVLEGWDYTSDEELAKLISDEYKEDSIKPKVEKQINIPKVKIGRVKTYNTKELLLKKEIKNFDIKNKGYKDVSELGAKFNKLYNIENKIGNKEELKKALSKYIDIGGTIDKAQWAKGSSSIVKKQLSEAFRNYPKNWSQIPKNNNKLLNCRKGKRGFFAEGAINSSGTQYISKLPNYETDYFTIVTDGTRNTTPYHEIGHMVEWNNPEILRIEKEFISSRTKNEEYTKMMDIFPGWGYNSSEKTLKDNFITPYIGKEYSNATEVLSVGLESIYEPGNGHIKHLDDEGSFVYAKITDDKEYLNLILGIILKG